MSLATYTVQLSNAATGAAQTVPSAVSYTLRVEPANENSAGRWEYTIDGTSWHAWDVGDVKGIARERIVDQVDGVRAVNVSGTCVYRMSAW